MPSNIAARRAAKANRRKAVLAQKRKMEQHAGSLAGRVALAASAPIRHCLLGDGWSECGMGALILTRGVTSSHLVMGTFLIDSFCLGVKDVLFRSIEGDEFDALIDAMDLDAPISPIDPAYGRKLLRDVTAWAASIGSPPHRSFAVVERLFGTVDANACTTEFQFGLNGTPFYVPGPAETPKQIHRRMERFHRRIEDADIGPLLEGSSIVLEG
jgi:hypothetical protein